MYIKTSIAIVSGIAIMAAAVAQIESRLCAAEPATQSAAAIDDACCTTSLPSATAGQTLTKDALACSLSGAEIVSRTKSFEAFMRIAVEDVNELPDGYAMRLKQGHAAALVEFIELERVCCPFFDFTLSFPPNQESITLTVTGPTGTKEMLSHLFGEDSVSLTE